MRRLGSGKAIVCPYHAWAYKHDGSMLRVRHRFDEDEHFRKDDHGLFEVPLRDWHGWLDRPVRGPRRFRRARGRT